MKRRIAASAAAIVIVAATAGSAAIAQRGSGPGGPAGYGLLQFDSNADGKLTRQEFDTALRARFNELDTNRDGFATNEEKKAARDAHAQQAKAERFAAMDKDGDGKLTQAELDAGSKRNGMGGRGVDGPRGMRGPGGPGRGEQAGDRPARGDSDGDGKISFAEFSVRPTEAFTRADSNKDGTVTISELQALRPNR